MNSDRTPAASGGDKPRDLPAMRFQRAGGRALFWALALVGMYALLGALVLPPIARAVLVRKASERLGRPVSIGRISFNPFTLAVTVQDFTLKDHDGSPLFSCAELHVDAQAVSLFKRGLVLRAVTLKTPALTLVRETEHRYNLTRLLDELAQPDTPDNSPFHYSINNIEIHDGRIDFEDRPEQATHAVRSLEVAVPFLSNLAYDAEQLVQPAFSAVVNETRFALTGRTKPFSESRETALDIELHALSLPRYLKYVPVPLDFRMPSGLVDARLALSFAQPSGQTPKLTLAGRITLKDLVTVDVRGAPLVELPAVEVTLAPSALLAQQIELSAIQIDKPRVALKHTTDGPINLTALLPKRAPEPAGPAANASSPWRIRLQTLVLRDGTIDVTDAAPGGAFSTRLGAITVAVRDFSSMPGHPMAVEATFRSEHNEQLQLRGQIQTGPVRVTGDLSVTGLLLPRYAPYYRRTLRGEVKSGTIGLKTHLDMELRGTTPDLRLSDCAVTVDGLRVRSRTPQAELLRVESFALRQGSLDLKQRRLHLGLVETRQGQLRIQRSPEGVVNLTTLLQPGPASAPSVPADPAWDVLIDRIAVSQWTLRLLDEVPEEPVTLLADRIALDAAHVTLLPDRPIDLSLRLRWQQAGAVAVRGRVVRAPLDAQLDVAIKDVDLVPLQPYFADQLNLFLTDADLSADGQLKLAAGPRASDFSYRGTLSVNHVQAIDKDTNEDLLQWETFYLGGVDIRSTPSSVTLGEVALSEFYARLIVGPDGVLNLRQLVNQAPSTPASPAATAASANSSDSDNEDDDPKSDSPAPTTPPARPATDTALPIRVDKFTLQGGVIDFDDRLVKPNFSASLRQVVGRITGLSSTAGKVADVDIKAHLGDQAPLEITGKLNPFGRELALDLNASFRDIDVTPFSPYSGKYAGYTLAKGRLTLTLNYNIAARRLAAQNNLFIDQLTLGDKVESKDKTKLPVRLVLALLKDRNGEIHLDLPLSGSLDNPKFNLARLILRVVRNVFVKAATAPFALLGGLVGHGAELSYLEFEPGSSAIAAAGEEKIRALAKALSDRPALELEITGRIDNERDREGLRRRIFTRKVKTEKLKELVRRGQPPPESLDALQFEPGEFDRLLKRVYKNERFPKPRNALGIAKELPPEEMSKLILTHIQVSDDELRHLAQERAQEVKQHLLAAGVTPARLFLVEPKQQQAAKTSAQLPSMRVDFAIK